ncbi:MAG TPA: hypothetical protein VFH94_16480 [Streptomyces sp.]|nr:hypothetical protein [Streptomyces sp.]
MNMPGLRLLLTTLLLGATLSACSSITSSTTCEDTEQAAAALDRLPELQLRPARATPVAGATNKAYCTQDSGDAWLTAERLYAHHGSRAGVQEYYTREAAAAGWRPVQDPNTGAGDSTSALCFESSGQPSLTLAFESQEDLREFYGVKPGPELSGRDARIWFSWSTETAPDGSPMGCSG